MRFYKFSTFQLPASLNTLLFLKRFLVTLEKTKNEGS